MTWFLVAIGGAVGTLARYGISRFAEDHPALGLPWGTLTANLLGSLLLGFIAARTTGRTLWGVELQAVLGVGVMGGFTTYSSFNLETIRLFEEFGLGRAALYVGLTLVCCLLGGLTGLVLGRSGS